MGEAETPGAVVVARHVRDRIGLVRQRVQMLLQILKTQLNVDWSRVAHDVKIAVRPIRDDLSGRAYQSSPADIPFIRNLPVENLSSGGNLMNRQFGEALLQDSEGFTNAVSCDASWDRPQALSEVVSKLPLVARSSCRKHDYACG